MSNIIKATATAGVLAIGLGLGLGACGGSGASASYNAQKIEQNIASRIYQQTAFTATVKCPSNPPINSYPATFKCLVTLQNYGPNNTAIATVTIQDSNGDYIWQTNA